VRGPLAPLQDVINDEGDIVVPVDPRYLGLWLTGLFGDPDTTDNLDGSWDHEFTSGGDDLPSYTLEVGMPKVPAFFLHAGVKLNSIALEFTRSGPAPQRSMPSPRARPGSTRARAAHRRASPSVASASSRARSSAPAHRSVTSPAARSPTPTTWRRSRPSATTV
jgi:hypothetical protein